MIGLLGAKIWKENNVDFGKPVNLVPVAAGLIMGIGLGTDRFFPISDNFTLGGIAAGTIIIVVVGYHLGRAVAPEDSTRARCSPSDCPARRRGPRRTAPHRTQALRKP